MAKTGAERARDYRERKREKRGIVPMMPVSVHEAFKAKARTFAESQMAEIERLTAALAEAEAGRRVPPCKACGGQLACPSCYRGDDF